MKEDLLMRRCKILDEINDDELEIKIPTNELNSNDIYRKIMLKPIVQTIFPDKLKKRNPYLAENEDVEESKDNRSGSHNFELCGFMQDRQQHPYFKTVYSYKYKTEYGPIEDEERPEGQEQAHGSYQMEIENILQKDPKAIDKL